MYAMPKMNINDNVLYVQLHNLNLNKTFRLEEVTMQFRVSLAPTACVLGHRTLMENAHA